MPALPPTVLFRSMTLFLYTLLLFDLFHFQSFNNDLCTENSVISTSSLSLLSESQTHVYLTVCQVAPLGFCRHLKCNVFIMKLISISILHSSYSPYFREWNYSKSETKSHHRLLIYFLNVCVLNFSSFHLYTYLIGSIPFVWNTAIDFLPSIFFY